jgi:hypothetical protein
MTEDTDDDTDTSDECPIPPPDPTAVVDDTQDTAGVPESDPRHVDPAGDIADAVESGDLELSLTADQHTDDLREFLAAVEAGEYDLVDPGLKTTVRIVRELLDDE